MLITFQTIRERVRTMSTASTINDVIRVSQMYGTVEEQPNELSAEDLAMVMGGSSMGGAKKIIQAVDDLTGGTLGKTVAAGELLIEGFHELLGGSSQAEIDQSMAEGQSSANAAYNSQYQVSYNEHAGDVRTVSGGDY
jgi:hypothetical protein